MWGELLPLIDSGALEIDFATVYHLNRSEYAAMWTDWTWHEVRDRIIRLCRTPGAILGDVEQPSTAAREAYRAVRGRAPSSADPSRRPGDVRPGPRRRR